MNSPGGSIYLVNVFQIKSHPRTVILFLPSSIWATDVRVRVDAGTPADAARFLEEIRKAGAKHGLRDVQDESGFGFRITASWHRSSAAKVAVLGIAPDPALERNVVVADAV